MRTTLVMACVLAILSASVADADERDPLIAPPHGTLKVAFVLSEGATMIDFAGPWEVFQDVLVSDRGRDYESQAPFELYTVAPSKTLLHTTGGHRPGMSVMPDYSFDDAPLPDIVVVGAQTGGPGFSEWLQKIHAKNKVIMSVCTGAFKLAKAGLLDGRQATTHHWHFDEFADQFPRVRLIKGVRYVQASPILFTSGGLSSGIDLALHLVAEYFGPAVAQNTADRMEYQGTGWKSNSPAVFPGDIPAVLKHN